MMGFFTWDMAHQLDMTMFSLSEYWFLLTHHVGFQPFSGHIHDQCLTVWGGSP